ncbi:hypothetical protein A3860_38045 [Niastella vici]|uniref:Uncharacterized protein n=1 Tax=Niastella vici TaxID=1703345 RepID=A0A1V9FLN3_9BACT|nr:hypothetical protein [Niastella vici]OQP59259.1 hypothetical protein A3860_38045 [Niastella vici]
MSRLKYTRRRVDIIKISSATKYLTPNRTFFPQTFSYFFDLEIFQPRTWINVAEMASLFEKSHDKALNKMREIQMKYKRPALNVVKVKDLCTHLKIDEEIVQEYFFHEEALAFFARADKLKSK